MTEQIVFYFLATVIAIFSVLAVTGKKVIRSATSLLLVLLATAGLFLQLNYHYLFAVQVTVYAGGIMVLFIMAIFLTHKPGQVTAAHKRWKVTVSALLAGSGLALCGYIVVKNVTRVYHYVLGSELRMQDLGVTMMGTEKHQYLLPFEVISLLLLACIVGAILIARKEPEQSEKDEDA